MRIALIIPTLNAEPYLDTLLPAIAKQTLQADVFLVIDSGSKDNTVAQFEQAGARVEVLASGTFNHGGTRRWASEIVDADICVFITQDAIFTNDNSLEELCRIFSEDDTVAATYARQLPHLDAGVLGAHARAFNYPAQSKMKAMSDAPIMGIKTCYMSDSCAAYRVSALKEVGGFPLNVIGSEDAYVGAKLVLAGQKIYYNANAEVYHSHDYSLTAEFQRYFDIGVFYGRERWIKEAFGNANKEGLRFIKSEIKTVNDLGLQLKILEVIFRTILKYAGFKLGYLERFLPLMMKRKISMFSNYWR